MKLSFIIPVYNVEKYIGRCLDSLISQNLDQSLYEIIVVNDGSPDRSAEIVERYAGKYPNIFLVSQANQGVSAARNKGLAIARGEWILFVDPDDFIEKDALKRVYHLLSGEEAEIVIFRSYEYGELCRQEVEPFPRCFTSRNFSGTALFRKKYIKASVWGAAFGRAFLQENHLLFSVSLKNSEDALFMALCYAFASKIRFSDCDYYGVYLRKGSASRCWDWERIEKMTRNLYVIREYIETCEFTATQQAILYYQVYITINYMLQNFFQLRIPGYRKLKKEIKATGFPPVPAGELPFIFKIRVLLLNCSIDWLAALNFVKTACKGMLLK